MTAGIIMQVQCFKIVLIGKNITETKYDPIEGYRIEHKLDRR